MSTISPNRLRKIKEQLNNGKSHSLWSMDLKSGHDLDGRWINDGL